MGSRKSRIATGSTLVICVFLASCGSGGSDGGSVTIVGDVVGGSVTSTSESDAVIDEDDDSDDSDGSDSEKDDEASNPSERDKITFEELMAAGAQADAFGVVIDSSVSGLRYKSGDHYGITDSAGTYGYIKRESVEFFIGDIQIGYTISPLPRVTPYELANGDEKMALNITRFLQTLDNDADPDNGIQINDAVQALAADPSVDFSLGDWREGTSLNFALVDGTWVVVRLDVELLVAQLTSATQAGARDLVSADVAFSHLVLTYGDIINSLKAEAKSQVAASTCETDQQCKWFHFSNRRISHCPPPHEGVVYSEVDADIAAIEMLEAGRVYLIDVEKTMWDTAWPDDRNWGSCSTNITFTRAICGEKNHCEITTSPVFIDLRLQV